MGPRCLRSAGPPASGGRAWRRSPRAPAQDLRKHPGGLAAGSGGLAPRAGPTLIRGSWDFLDLLCALPGGPLARAPPRPGGCLPRRRSRRPRAPCPPGPGPPTHRGERSSTASASRPSQTRRQAEARADGGAGGRRSSGRARAGSGFPAKAGGGRRARGGVGERRDPRPGPLARAPPPGGRVPGVPRGPGRRVRGGGLPRSPKAHRWADTLGAERPGEDAPEEAGGQPWDSLLQRGVSSGRRSRAPGLAWQLGC